MQAESSPSDWETVSVEVKTETWKRDCTMWSGEYTKTGRLGQIGHAICLLKMILSAIFHIIYYIWRQLMLWKLDFFDSVV